SDEGSDNDSDETVKSGAGKDGDEDDDEDDDYDDKEEELAKNDEEDKETVSLEPPSPIMTASTIATITISGEAPIPPPTIPSIILENLLTFN
nr:hypothetical protein [Tanacetum cinerariifolium]